MMWSGLSKFRESGLFLLRLGLGAAMILHGWPKLDGGRGEWEKLAAQVGFAFFPAFWGMLAAVIETGGGALLILGFMFRPVCFLLLLEMGAAVISIVQHSTPPFDRYAHPAELGVVFLGLMIVGPGKYSVDREAGGGGGGGGGGGKKD